MSTSRAALIRFTFLYQTIYREGDLPKNRRILIPDHDRPKKSIYLNPGLESTQKISSDPDPILANSKGWGSGSTDPNLPPL